MGARILHIARRAASVSAQQRTGVRPRDICPDFQGPSGKFLLLTLCGKDLQLIGTSIVYHLERFYDERSLCQYIRYNKLRDVRR